MPLVAAAAVLIVLAGCLPACGEPRDVTAGFWFEPVAYESTLLGPLSAADLTRIEEVARREVATAFAPFRVTLSDRRDARYRVRVMQELMDARMKRQNWVAGHAFGMRGFGGSGAVSFVYFAQGAQAYAPPQTPRAEVIDAIGRGLGRSAAHEFAHQFLPGHGESETRDRASYEYHAASRPEQYFGPMHWDAAAPLLERRLGLSK